MNKSELVDTVYESACFSKAATARALEAVIELITDELSKNTQVTLPGFGMFSVRNRSERSVKNPRTGEVLSLKANRTPFFKPGKAFKDSLNS